MRARMVCWGIAILTLAPSRAALADDLALINAVKNQDKAAIAAQLKQRANVNARQPDGATALHWAAHRDDLETAALLLDAGADVNAANDLGVTPLVLAIVNGNAAMVDTLLAARANANVAALSTGETPLMAAARTGHATIVRALLAHGADVNVAETAHGQTALMWAAARGHSAVVSTLIEVNADVKKRSNASRRLVYVGPRGGGGGARASHVSDLPGVHEVGEGGFSPLLFAARSGDAESARLLIRAGADPNDAGADGTTALIVAAHSGNGAVAAALLENGADPNAANTGYSAVHAAVLRGDLQLVKALLHHGANPNARLTQGTPARRFSHDYAFNQALLGATPFLLAAKYREVDMMRALVEAGADPHIVLNDGTTSVMLAVGSGSGTDRRDRGYAAIGRVAAQNDRAEAERRTLDTTKLAIDLGGDVTAANSTGDTALHGAVATRSNAVIELLVASGAKLDVKNELGQTPLMVATASRGREAPSSAENSTAALLRQLGATQ